MKTYQVLSNLNHDNIYYAPGGNVDMSEAQAQELIKLGVIEEPRLSEEAKAAAPAGSVPASVEAEASNADVKDAKAATSATSNKKPKSV